MRTCSGCSSVASGLPGHEGWRVPQSTASHESSTQTRGSGNPSGLQDSDGETGRGTRSRVVKDLHLSDPVEEEYGSPRTSKVPTGRSDALCSFLGNPGELQTLPCTGLEVFEGVRRTGGECAVARSGVLPATNTDSLDDRCHLWVQIRTDEAGPDLGKRCGLVNRVPGGLRKEIIIIKNWTCT